MCIRARACVITIAYRVRVRREKVYIFAYFTYMNNSRFNIRAIDAHRPFVKGIIPNDKSDLKLIADSPSVYRLLRFFDYVNKVGEGEGGGIVTRALLNLATSLTILFSLHRSPLCSRVTRKSSYRDNHGRDFSHPPYRAVD